MAPRIPILSPCHSQYTIFIWNKLDLLYIPILRNSTLLKKVLFKFSPVILGSNLKSIKMWLHFSPEWVCFCKRMMGKRQRKHTWCWGGSFFFTASLFISEEELFETSSGLCWYLTTSTPPHEVLFSASGHRCCCCFSVKPCRMTSVVVVLSFSAFLTLVVVAAAASEVDVRRMRITSGTAPPMMLIAESSSMVICLRTISGVTFGLLSWLWWLLGPPSPKAWFSIACWSDLWRWFRSGVELLVNFSFSKARKPWNLEKNSIIRGANQV